MDLSNIPKPIWYALTAFLLLTIGYGAANHVPGLNSSDKESAENKASTVPNSSSVKVSVFDEATQAPVVGAKVIVESQGGSDTDTTDNLGAFRVQIPTTDYVKVRISKNYCEPYNQDLNLKSNPDRPKPIFLKCSVPQKKYMPSS
ncbi:MAG: carboxypeptidase-like regulatory domain-containing protein [Nostoc sp.]|uniref:carboxypeptidase-like regulatory domain-containing protein n=1 Tax=Nostoc sp. TaxID=1180 RepID=UPI002FF82709